MGVFKFWDLKDEEIPEEAESREIQEDSDLTELTAPEDPEDSEDDFVGFDELPGQDMEPEPAQELPPEPISTVAPAVPLTKKERKAAEKEHRRRLKQLVHQFRIRSFGLDFLALLGIGVTVLMTMEFDYGKISACAGGGLILLALLLMLISWFPARRNVMAEEPDAEEQWIWRRKIYVIGIRTIRLMVIFLAAPLSLYFVMSSGSEAVTWIRWGMFAAEFAVLAVALLMAFHSFRGKRTGKVWLWRILAVLLISGAACGQVYFNRGQWTSLQKGKRLDHFADLKILMEQEKEDTPPVDGDYTDKHGRSISRDEYLRREIYGSDGVLLYTYEHYNTDIVYTEPHYGSDSVQPDYYTVYSRAEQEEGFWKMDSANLVWFAVYPVILLACFIGWKARGGRRIDPKEEYDTDVYESDDYDAEW